MRKLIRVGIRMIALSWPLSVAGICGVIPGWTLPVSQALLAGGTVNLVIAGIFEVRRTLRDRAERREHDAGCLPYGRAENGSTACECRRQELGLTRAGGIINRAGQLVGYVRPEHVPAGWVSPREYYLRHGVSLIEATVSYRDWEDIRDLPREDWQAPGGRVTEVLPLATATGAVPHARPEFPSVSVKVFNGNAELLGKALARMPPRMAPCRVPGCGCSERD